MTTLEILKGARELISVPERWGKQFSAQNENGNYTDACASNAVRWCAIGALIKVSPFDDDAVRALRACLPESTQEVSIFNDLTDHAGILDLFDRAIARLEAQ